ncbi:MAG: helix-turn-helix domain-containing protein [Spirochaetes bacterium]|nr:helix-turn-helix domain-containing protein [Spirochaetota bacterium]
MQERESISEISKKYGIHPNMISRWKKEFLDRAPELFYKPRQEKKGEVDIEKLYAKIGQLQLEPEF